MSLISKRKGQFLFAGILVILAIVTFYFWNPQDLKTGPEESPVPESSKVPSLPSTSHRQVIGSDQQPLKSPPSQLPQNIPSPEWKSSLQNSIIKQGGADLQELKITPLESLIWVHEGKSLNVETAKISFKAPDGREISFKAMVDSQTGKILQTWDQPVFDDFSHKDKSGIKLDPRYLGQ